VQGLGRCEVTWREDRRMLVERYPELIRHAKKEETL
jgi:hypothetical protein